MAERPRTVADPNLLAELARRYWETLVRVTRLIPPKNIEKTAETLAAACGQGKENVRSKMTAIRYLLDLGRSEEYLLSQGQENVLREYREMRRLERLDPQATMSWRVTESTRQAVRHEVFRCMRILGIKDAETFWTWMHSEMSLWTPQQIRHSAGEPRLRHAERSRRAERPVDHATRRSEV